MSIIKPIFYQKVSCDPKDLQRASDFYFYSNLLGYSPEIDEKYLQHELHSIKTCNEIVGDAIRNQECPASVNVPSATIGISSIQKSTIVMVDY